jgi:hypothetical protein
MKNRSVTRQIVILLPLFAFIFLNIPESFSQDMLTFKNGSELNVVITYQTKDTVKYFLESNPDITYIETMNNIYKITPVESTEGYIPDSLKDNKDYMKYLHYKRVTTSGIILMPLGAVIGGIGVAFSGGLTIGLGGGLFITGIIKTISGSVKMHKYKDKLKGFSLDLKCTPQEQGIVVVYRFP